MLRTCCVVGLMALGLVGCSSDGPVATEGSAPSANDEAPAESTATSETVPNENPLGGNSPEDELMPDVLCMDLQSAQDEIQDHGVFLSGSTDATGQGRSQVIDSNWVVVDQSPEPGSPIDEGDAELFVVKFGEESTVGSGC